VANYSPAPDVVVSGLAEFGERLRAARPKKAEVWNSAQPHPVAGAWAQIYEKSSRIGWCSFS